MKKTTERKLRILEAVIDEYIKTGEPIASKHLAENCGFDISPATIRSVLAELETEGYLEHPHTSAGRVPTIKAYKYYIDRTRTALINGENDDVLIALPIEEQKQLDAFFGAISGESDEVMIESATRALAEVTKCAVAASVNTAKFSVITKVEVIPTGRRIYALLLITSGGEVKNKVCRLSFDLTDEQIKFFSDFVRDNLEGISIARLSDEYIEDLALSLGSYMMSLLPLLNAVSDLTGKMRQDNVVLKGETNLITSGSIPSDEVVRIIERRNELADLLNGAFSDITVSFGNIENPGTIKHTRPDIFAIENAGVITGGVKKGSQVVGGFGIIGPVRLDYRKIIPYMEYFTSRVSVLLSRNENDDHTENQ